jgi:hypothetical protein
VNQTVLGIGHGLAWPVAGPELETLLPSHPMAESPRKVRDGNPSLNR